MGESDLLGRQPLLFGVDIPTAIGAVTEPVVAAQTAEAVGFDFVSSDDPVFADADRDARVERLAREVVPAVRAAA